MEEENDLQALLDAANTDIENLTAERDSLAEELAELRASMEDTRKELAETKKLNYTLGRRLDVSGQKSSAEDILGEMLKESERR